jgi:hypothetical protein
MNLPTAYHMCVAARERTGKSAARIHVYDPETR